MTCLHYKYHPATWGYDGGSPAEDECTHPDHDEAECEDCPDFYSREDARMDAGDIKCHAEREERSQ